MGTQTAPGTLLEDRQTATLNDVIEYYRRRNGGIPLTENIRENFLSGHCPLPTHQRKGGKSFRIRIDPTTQTMLSWQCFSASCIAARTVQGNNAAALVAAMECCSIEDAQAMIRGGLLSGVRPPHGELRHQNVW